MHIDDDIIEKTLEEKLIAMRLTPTRNEGCVLTGYNYFHIHKGEVQVFETEDKSIFLASVELNAILKDKRFGEVVIGDLVTTQAESANLALEKCTSYYMDVTFPALQALFDDRFLAPNSKLILASYTESKNLLINWKVLTGQTQVLNDTSGQLIEYLSNQIPLSFVFDTVTGHLSDPTLHWCKLYIGFKQKDVVFGCSIDGRKSIEAELEMKAKFNFPKTIKGWEIRQFFLFLPDGDKKNQLVSKLQNHTAQLNKPVKKWWKFW